MEINVDKGLGYVPADKNKRADQPIGVIPVDSIYSPITRVKFGVTDTRVGNVTNYDKLTLEVWTDGSVEPDTAVSMASGIMIDYLKMFQPAAETASGIITVSAARKKLLQKNRAHRQVQVPFPLTTLTFPYVPTTACAAPASTRLMNLSKEQKKI